MLLAFCHGILASQLARPIMCCFGLLSCSPSTLPHMLLMRVLPLLPAWPAAEALEAQK